MQRRPTVLASAVLALALLGDSLLYVVLPLHAATFGISLAWTGVLLSVNRVVRLFTYPLLARAAGHIGLRRFTVAAATAGGLTTLAFAVASGKASLLAVRIAWGITFGCLSLATLAYATQSEEKAGSRVGLSLSLRELGPVVSLTAGTLLVTQQGVRSALGTVGALSLLAVPIALLLPDLPIERHAGNASRPDRALRPTRHEVRSLVLGLVADGIFPATVALLLAPWMGVSGAAAGAGMLLALKRAAVVVVSPAAGHAADRWGARTTTMTGVAATAGGALLIACHQIAAGSVLFVCGAAVASATMPLCVRSADVQQRLAGHARIGVARDAGAAAGPLLATALFDAAGPTLLYVAAAVVLLASVSVTAGEQRVCYEAVQRDP